MKKVILFIICILVPIAHSCPGLSNEEACIQKAEQICERAQSQYQAPDYFQTYLNANQEQVNRDYQQCQRELFPYLNDAELIEQIDTLSLETMTLEQMKEFATSPQIQNIFNDMRLQSSMEYHPEHFSLVSEITRKTPYGGLQNYSFLGFTVGGRYVLEEYCEQPTSREHLQTRLQDSFRYFSHLNEQDKLNFFSILGLACVPDQTYSLANQALNPMSDFLVPELTINSETLMDAIMVKYLAGEEALQLYREALADLKQFVAFLKSDYTEANNIKKNNDRPVVSTLADACLEKVRFEFPYRDFQANNYDGQQLTSVFQQFKQNLKKLLRQRLRIEVGAGTNLGAVLSQWQYQTASQESLEVFDRLIDDLTMHTFTGEPHQERGSNLVHYRLDSAFQAFYITNSNAIVVGYPLVKDFFAGRRDAILFVLAHEIAHAIEGSIFDHGNQAHFSDRQRVLISDDTKRSYSQVFSVCQEQFELDTSSRKEDAADFIGAHLLRSMIGNRLDFDGMLPLIGQVCQGSAANALRDRNIRDGHSHSIGSERVLRLLYLGLDFPSEFRCDPNPLCNQVLHQ